MRKEEIVNSHEEVYALWEKYNTPMFAGGNMVISFPMEFVLINDKNYTLKPFTPTNKK